MNLWIAKLNTPGGITINDTHKLNKILFKRFQTTTENFEYKTKYIHYISFIVDSKKIIRQYNYQNGRLYSYSGLIVEKQTGNNDYRNAKNLSDKSLELPEIAKSVNGQFALIDSTETQFRCVVDAIGMHKVFYFKCPQGEIYVSNYLPFIQNLKESDINLPFLINFINNGGTYGYSSIEKNVFTLPENGVLLWTKENGLVITSYEDFKEFYLPSKIISLSELVTEFNCEASYLSEKHNILIPLSGGFDSRTVLNMFSGKNSNNITTFTYPDHPYDLKIAKKISHNNDIAHVELKPQQIPDVDELHKFIIKNYPLACYSSVFDYLFYEQKQKIRGWDKVEIRGNGGDTDLGIKKFGDLSKVNGQQAIQILAKKLINNDLLTEYGEQVSIQNFTDHYSKKYLELSLEVPGFNLPTAHFIFERFASYQGHKYSAYIFDGQNDIYLPFADRDYIKLLFSSDTTQLMRGKNGSIHHQLTNQLINGHIKPIPFTTSVHWNANKFDRGKYLLKRRYIDKFLSKIQYEKMKYSNHVRLSFLNTNAEHFKDVIHSYPNSGIWEYIDLEKLTRVFDNPKKLSKSMKPIFRIVPLLKEGI
jgi:asparagine synthetase B (glutamine-hydrolysing)